MTSNPILTELVRRCVPADATPEEKAIRHREIAAAVKSAGRYAEPALMLIEAGNTDVFDAFQAQVQAFKATAPKKPKRDHKVRATASTYVRGL